MGAVLAVLSRITNVAGQRAEGRSTAKLHKGIQNPISEQLSRVIGVVAARSLVGGDGVVVVSLSLVAVAARCDDPKGESFAERGKKKNQVAG